MISLLVVVHVWPHRTQSEPVDILLTRTLYNTRQSECELSREIMSRPSLSDHMEVLIQVFISIVHWTCADTNEPSNLIGERIF